MYLLLKDETHALSICPKFTNEEEHRLIFYKISFNALCTTLTDTGSVAFVFSSFLLPTPAFLLYFFICPEVLPPAPPALEFRVPHLIEAPPIPPAMLCYC